MLRYRSGRGLPGTPGSPGGLAVDRTRGRGGESSRRAESQESSDPTVARGLGRKLGFSHGRRVNGLSGGAKLRSGRNGREPASPKEPNGRRGRRAGRLARRTGGLNDRGEVASRSRRRVSQGPSGGPGGAARRRRAAESGREKLGLFASDERSKPNPQGSRRPPEGGTAPREGKALKGEPQGRLRHGTRPRSSGASGVTSGSGQPGSSGATRLNPPGG